MTVDTLQVLSFGTGLLAYVALLFFCIATWINGITGRALFLAALFTTGFILSTALTGASALSHTLEVLAIAAWILLILRAIGLDRERFRSRDMRGIAVLAILSTLVVCFCITVAWALPADAFRTQNQQITPLFLGEVLLCVCGLVAVEQLTRNTREDLRWRLRYLNIGLGLIFSYGLLHAATGTLFNARLPVLSIIHPIILATAVPFIIVASLRNRSNQLQFNLSRRFVFQSGVLIGTGLFLLTMGMIGYFLRITGGDLVLSASILITVLTLVGALTIAGSSTFRMKLRRFLGQHLFRNTYDYQDYWARVTDQLTEPDPDFTLEQQAIRSLLDVFDSTGGALWLIDGGTLVQSGVLHVDWHDLITAQSSHELATYFQSHERVIDLAQPATGQLHLKEQELLSSCLDLKAFGDLRFLVPLINHSRLVGLVGIRTPLVPYQFGSEDQDLVRLVARQAAGFLALRIADRKLSESRQFDSMNRMTAFLVHDIKTIAAQLSLMTENAKRHKSNPAFIDDMLLTIDNAGARMQKLLNQLTERKADSPVSITMGELLPSLVDRYAAANPRPRLASYDAEAAVIADPDKLAAAIGHALQNAIDATEATGSIRISTEVQPPWLNLRIEDNGTGMDPDFVEKQLFTPFSSTKGVAGMGIGAFQVREYLRQMGGDVLVHSIPDQGSCFTFKLPLAAAAT